MEKLIQKEPQISELHQFLASNRTILQGEIYGPIAPSITLNNPTYALYLYQAIGLKFIMGFVTNNEEVKKNSFHLWMERDFQIFAFLTIQIPKQFKNEQ